MTTLFILILIQVVGIVISVFVSYFAYLIDKKRTFIRAGYRTQILSKKENWPWLIEYFQLYPKSSLRYEFPHLYKVAKATKRYQEINLLRKKGLLSEKKYEKELDKILPLIDIKADLEQAPSS
jgi:uncharacterized membrane protein